MNRRRPNRKIARVVLEQSNCRAAPACYWIHVDNDGWRSPAEAAIFQSFGVTTGISGLILIGAASWQLETWGLVRGRAI
jgi:hypothetical protein